MTLVALKTEPPDIVTEKELGGNEAWSIAESPGTRTDDKRAQVAPTQTRVDARAIQTITMDSKAASKLVAAQADVGPSSPGDSEAHDVALGRQTRYNSSSDALVVPNSTTSSLQAPMMTASRSVGVLEPGTPRLAGNKAAPPVRRVKSFGDLLSARRTSQIIPTAIPTEPKSRAVSSGAVEAACGASRPLSTLSHAAPPMGSTTRPNVLQKRRSSLGLGRRPSSTMLSSRRPSQENAPPVPPLPLQSSQATYAEKAIKVESITPRNASSVTAPATLNPAPAEPRKRKGSGFSFIPNFFRSRALSVKEIKDVSPPVTPILAIPPPVVVSTPSGEIITKVGEVGTSVSAPERPEPQKPSEAEGVEVHSETPKTTPAADPQPSRRISIFPSFFRSSSASSTSSVTKAAPKHSQSLDLPILSTPKDEGDDQQPDAIRPPQLPAVEAGVGDITFTSLFDLEKRKPRSNRSRSSTKSSVASPINMYRQRSSSIHRDELDKGTPDRHAGTPGTPSSAQNLAQDYLSARRLSISSLRGTGPPVTPPAAEPVSSPASSLGQTLSPASPTIQLRSSNSRSTRLARSNSASSATSTRHALYDGMPMSSSVNSLLSFQSGDVSNRPIYARSRSSSTLTSRSLSKSIVYRGSIDSTSRPRYSDASPAITITPQQPFFESSVRFDDPPQSSSNARSWPENSDSAPTSMLTATAPQRQASPSVAALFGGPSKANPSILKKTLRRRANTASSLSASTPASATNSAGSPSDASLGLSLSATSPNAGLLGKRRSSSSRLSSFFSSSPTTPLSSSPTANAPWVSSPSQHVEPSEATTRLQNRLRSGSSPLLGSPSLSLTGEAWSSSSSLGYSPRTSASNLPDSEPLTPTSFFDTSAPSQRSSFSNVANSTTSSARSKKVPDRGRSGSSYNRSRLSVQVEDDDTAESFLKRVKDAVPTRELAAILASSGDGIHLAALRRHLAEFDFRQDPIDIALRRLLLGLHLPRETQQIDRLMEAFAEQYNACNDGLFTTSDQPYILAFSLIMLHTDAFNKSNKSKMTKADYVKNTRIDGISTELLEYLYDNITYTPFIYADDDSHPIDERSDFPAGTAPTPITSPSHSRTREDVYAMLTSRSLGRLTIDVDIPLKNPYSYTGTVAFFDCSAIHNAFHFAHILDIPSPYRKQSDPTSPLAASLNLPSSIQIKMVKIGILERKDDLVQGGRRASSRKWKPYSVMLAGSQLLLFKDSTFATALNAQIIEHAGTLAPPQCEEHRRLLPRVHSFKPDGIISLLDTVALYDFTYSKYPNVFHLLQPDGSRIMFHVRQEDELNSWVSMINYAATFRSCGIRMRGTNSKIATQLDGLSAEPQVANTSSASRNLESNHTASPYVLAIRATPGSSIKEKPNGVPVPGIDGRPDSGRLVTLSPSSHSHTALARQGSRSNIIRAKILELEGSIGIEQRKLASDIHIVRNLTILTPFHASARQRVKTAMQPVSRRVRASRQTISKLVCQREVLCRDLLASEREPSRDLLQTSSALSTTSTAGRRGRDIVGHITATGASSGQSAKTSSALARSTSGDELGRIVGHASVMRRTLSSTTEPADDPGDPPMLSPLSSTSTSTSAITIISSSQHRFGNSPVLASSPFETVQEEQESPQASPELTPDREHFFDAEDRADFDEFPKFDIVQ